MAAGVVVSRYVARWMSSPFGHADDAPWQVTQNAKTLVRSAIARLGPDFAVANEVAIHASATIEPGVVLKGPLIVGPRCRIGAGAYLRDGVYLDEDCGVGPGCELKSGLLFKGAKIAHLSFVGDSILGSDVNIEAGAIIANHRNELDDKTIRIALGAEVIETGVEKFGALVGDRTKIGANAVIAPGALLAPGTKVGRLQLIDQQVFARQA